MFGPLIITPGDALYKVKLTFFDRDRVRTALDKRTWKFFGKFGAYVRSDAKRSMKKRKRSAPPFHPPSVHEGSLKKFLYFGYEHAKRSVVVGPVKLSRRGPSGKRQVLEGPSPNALAGEVPAVLEHGGNNIPSPNPRRLKRKIGDYGAFAVGRYGGNGRYIRNYRGQQVFVTFAQIRTPAQLAHVERTETLVFGPWWQNHDLAPRPYMGPAFHKNLEQINKIWAGI